MATEIIRIKEGAEVLPGFSAKGALIDEPAGTVQVVTAHHLTKGEPYRYLPEHRLRITPHRLIDKYMLSPGDILFMSRGSNNYAVLLEQFPQPAIAPLTFFILKPKAGIVPSYLAWCLNQEPVKAQINTIRTGAATPLIPRDAFADINIPMPPVDLQKQIAYLSNLQAKEENLLRLLGEETDRVYRLTGQRILTKLTGVI